MGQHEHLHRQPFPAGQAAAFKNQTAFRRFHAGPESMDTFVPEFLGLIRAFWHAVSIPEQNGSVQGGGGYDLPSFLTQSAN